MKHRRKSSMKKRSGRKSSHAPTKSARTIKQRRTTERSFFTGGRQF